MTTYYPAEAIQFVGRCRKFPAIQHRGDGEFIVTKSRHKTPDKCSCFMCGKSFTCRRNLKKHFSACAKENRENGIETSNGIANKTETGDGPNKADISHRGNSVNKENQDNIQIIYKSNHTSEAKQGLIQQNEITSLNSRNTVDENTNKNAAPPGDGLFESRGRGGHSPTGQQQKRPRSDSVNRAGDTDRYRKQPRSESPLHVTSRYGNHVPEVIDNKCLKRGHEDASVKTEDDDVPCKNKRLITDKVIQEKQAPTISSKYAKIRMLDTYCKSYSTIKRTSQSSRNFSSIFRCSMCCESFTNQIALLNHHKLHMSQGDSSTSVSTRHSHRSFSTVHVTESLGQRSSRITDGSLDKEVVSHVAKGGNIPEAASRKPRDSNMQDEAVSHIAKDTNSNVIREDNRPPKNYTNTREYKERFITKRHRDNYFNINEIIQDNPIERVPDNFKVKETSYKISKEDKQSCKPRDHPNKEGAYDRTSRDGVEIRGGQETDYSADTEESLVDSTCRVTRGDTLAHYDVLDHVFENVNVGDVMDFLRRNMIVYK